MQKQDQVAAEGAMNVYTSNVQAAAPEVAADNPAIGADPATEPAVEDITATTTSTMTEEQVGAVAAAVEAEVAPVLEQFGESLKNLDPANVDAVSIAKKAGEHLGNFIADVAKLTGADTEKKGSPALRFMMDTLDHQVEMAKKPAPDSEGDRKRAAEAEAAAKAAVAEAAATPEVETAATTDAPAPAEAAA